MIHTTQQLKTLSKFVLEKFASCKKYESESLLVYPIDTSVANNQGNPIPEVDSDSTTILRTMW